MINLKFVQKSSFYSFKRCVDYRNFSLYLIYSAFFCSLKNFHKHQYSQNSFNIFRVRTKQTNKQTEIPNR